MLGEDAVDLDVLDDAARPRPGALGQRLRGVDRVGDAVAGQVHAADQVVDVGQRNAAP